MVARENRHAAWFLCVDLYSCISQQGTAMCEDVVRGYGLCSCFLLRVLLPPPSLLFSSLVILAQGWHWLSFLGQLSGPSTVTAFLAKGSGENRSLHNCWRGGGDGEREKKNFAVR